MSEQDEVRALVNELFQKVEMSQGMFHVSDGGLAWGREAVRSMKEFLRKHGEL